MSLSLSTLYTDAISRGITLIKVGVCLVCVLVCVLVFVCVGVCVGLFGVHLIFGVWYFNTLYSLTEAG